MGRPPKQELAPTPESKEVFNLFAVAKTHAEANRWIHQIMHPDDTPNWDNFRVRVHAWQKLGTLYAHKKEAREALKAHAQLFKVEHAGLKEWYEHERVERLEDLVEQLGESLWAVLSPFISEDQQGTARAAHDAAITKLVKR